MITIGQIAKYAKVSRYTASKVLNGDLSVRKETRDRIFAICKEFGYIPNLNAVNLVRGKSNLIGLIVPYVTDGFYNSMIEVLEHRIQSSGYMLIYKSSYNDAEIERQTIRQFLSLNICSLLIVPVVKDPDTEIHRLARKNIPVVYLDRPFSVDSYCVLNDNLFSARIMTEHLLTHTKNLAFLDSFYGNDNPTSADRRAGYEQTMKQHGLSPQVISAGSFSGKQDNEDYAYEVMKRFFRSGKTCDALFCVTDESAFGAARAVREIGRTPGKDFFIGGHDNLRFSAYANPPITTVEQPVGTICETALHLLSMLRNGEKPERMHWIFPGTLIVRDSG